MSDIDEIEELNRLQELDPEFFSYLQENDQQLLSSIQEDQKLLSTPTSPLESLVFSNETFVRLSLKAKNDRCFKSLRALLSAYRAAVRSFAPAKAGAAEAGPAGIRIDSEALFEALVSFMLRETPTLLLEHAGSRKSGDKITMASRYSKVRHLAHVWLGESLVLAQSTAATETVGEIFAALAKETSIDFLAEEKKLKHLVFKVAVNFWASAETDSTRRAVFEFIRKFVASAVNKISDKFPIIEPLMKRMVHAVAVNLEKNPGRVAVVDEIADHLSEIFAHSYEAAFKVAMVAIRQLAIVLTAALGDKKTNNNSAHNAVFSLSFLRAIRLWVRVVSKSLTITTTPTTTTTTTTTATTTKKATKQHIFGSLVFPLSSIIQIAARAKESHAAYAPYVAALAEEATALMAASGKYIAISGVLLKALSVAAGRLGDSKANAVSAAKLPNVETTAKVAEALAKDNKVVVNQLVCLLVRRLAEHLAVLAQTVAFRETTHVVAAELKRILKVASFAKTSVRPLVQAIEETAALCEKLRKKDEVVKKAEVMLFAVEGGDAVIRKLLDGQVLKVAEAGKFGKSADAKTDNVKTLSAAELKAAVAAEADGRTKRSLKRERQNAKRNEKDAKRRRKNELADSGLVEMVLSDDE